MAVEGLPFIGKLTEFIAKKLYATINKVGASRAALDVINRGFYAVNPLTTPLVVEAGSDDNLVVLTAHGAKPGDVVRLITTANAINEFEIVIDEIVDANSFRLAGYLSADLTAGDTFHLLRPIMELMSSDGASLASITAPPVQYNRVLGGITTVTTVTEDLDVPANSRPLPVQLYGFTGPISITTDEINVRSVHTNDSITIGNGDIVNPYLMNVDANRNAYFTLRDGNVSIELDGANRNLYTAFRDGTNSAEISNNRNFYMTMRFWDGDSNNEWNISDTGAGLVEIENDIASDEMLQKIRHAINGATPTLPFLADAIPAAQTDETIDDALVAYIRGILGVINDQNIAIGTQASATEVNPANNAALISYIRGLLSDTNDLNTVIGATNDGAYADGTGVANGSLDSLLKGAYVQQFNLNTVMGLITSAAYTDVTGAANGTLAGMTKGLFVSLNDLIGAPTSTTAVTAYNAADANVLEILRGLLRRMELQLPAALNSQLAANSFSIVPAQEYVSNNSLRVAETNNTTGSAAKANLTDAGTAALAAPVNAVGFILKNLAVSEGTLHWEIGAAATIASSDLVGGQGTAFIPCTGTVNLYSEGATSYAIQWIVK